MKCLCIIPVFNEDNKLNNLIYQIKKNKYKKFKLDYLFINNGSTDNSLKIIKNSKIKYLHVNENKGVGYALMLGYLYAKENNFNYVIHLAGNGKMKPSEINRFMIKMLKYNFDFVSGSRFLKGSSKKNNPLIRIVLIRLFTTFIKFILNKEITDASCGFRAFKTNIFENFRKKYFRKNLYTYGYEYFTYGKILTSKNIRYTEVPVSMNYPSKGKYSKIRPVLDWYIIVKFWIKGILTSEKL